MVCQSIQSRTRASICNIASNVDMILRLSIQCLIYFILGSESQQSLHNTEDAQMHNVCLTMSFSSEVHDNIGWPSNGHDRQSALKTNVQHFPNSLLFSDVDGCRRANLPGAETCISRPACSGCPVAPAAFYSHMFIKLGLSKPP